MKVYELLTLMEGPIKDMMAGGVSAADVKYLKMYREYLAMKREGNKIGYIVAVLQDKYGYSDRWIYSTVKKLERELPA